MSRRSSGHGSIADRVAATRQHATEPATESVPTLKHCWYDGPGGRQAALLLGWRQVSPGSAWEGHIAVASAEEDGWALVTRWVAAGMLTPA